MAGGDGRRRAEVGGGGGGGRGDRRQEGRPEAGDVVLERADAGEGGRRQSEACRGVRRRAEEGLGMRSRAEAGAGGRKRVLAGGGRRRRAGAGGRGRTSVAWASLSSSCSCARSCSVNGVTRPASSCSVAQVSARSTTTLESDPPTVRLSPFGPGTVGFAEPRPSGGRVDHCSMGMPSASSAAANASR